MRYISAVGSTTIRSCGINIKVAELMYNKEYTYCCGWSGTVHWADKEIAINEAKNRVKELKETGTNVFLTACPLCELGLGYGLEENEKHKYKILDISELLLKLI